MISYIMSRLSINKPSMPNLSRYALNFMTAGEKYLFIVIVLVHYIQVSNTSNTFGLDNNNNCHNEMQSIC